MKQPMKKPVRKSKPYDPKTFPDLAQKFAKLGATDVEIAEALGVDDRQLYRLKNLHPEFAAALTIGKAEADDRVERALYKRALGYTVKRQKPLFKDGIVTIAEYEEEMPPDVGAIIWWLKNRRPDMWRERQNLIGGNSGDAVNIEISGRVSIEARLDSMAEILAKKPPVTIDAQPFDVKEAIGRLSGDDESE